MPTQDEIGNWVLTPAEYQQYGLQTKAAKLLSDLWDDPAHGMAVKNAAKAHNPSLRIPELDVLEPALTPLRAELETERTTRTALEERLAKLESSITEDKEVSSLQSQLGAAQRKYRLTDGGMQEVRKLMIEKNIADPDVVAGHVVANIEPVKPQAASNWGPADLNVLNIKGDSAEQDVQLLHNDPVAWQDKAVAEIMAEFEAAA